MKKKIILLLLLCKKLFGASIVGEYIELITTSLGKVNTMLAEIQQQFIGAYSTLIITLYILFIGYFIIYGKKKFEIEEIIRLGIFVPIFLTISLNISLFNSTITKPIAGISTELSNQIFIKGNLPTGENAYDTIGKGVTTLITMGTDIVSDSGLMTQLIQVLIGGVLVVIGFILVYNILVIFTLALINITIYSWFLVFTLWLLPIKELTHIPKENFKQIVTYSLYVPIMSIIIVIFYNLVMDIVNQVTESYKMKMETEPLKLVFLLINSLIFLKTLGMIGEIASALTGGRSSSTEGGLNMAQLKENSKNMKANTINAGAGAIGFAKNIKSGGLKGAFKGAFKKR